MEGDRDVRIKKEPGEIWKEYQDGVAYNTQLGLYETVQQNNDFYNDRQWEGVRAPDLDKPVFNFLKPVVNYYIAMLISDEIAANVELTGGKSAPDAEKAISQEISRIMERENVSFKNRRGIRNAAVDGDVCFYNWFDPDLETGQAAEGGIRTELIDNTNVIFGDPSQSDPQKQPYIIIAMRRLTESVREEAEEWGLDPGAILPDSDCIYMNDTKNADKQYTTVLLKMWMEKKKKNGRTVRSMRMVKACKDGFVKPAWDTDYRLYPVSWMSWEAVKNCYHGVSPITGKIQNQIFVNKSYAMAMMFVTRMAFPKIIYDKTKIPQGWDNRVGTAVAVIGNPNDALFSNFAAADMSPGVTALIDSTISQTKDLMGANETALGNVRPENASAIITIQNQSRIQLDMQRLDFYNCVEGYIRSWIDMMRVHYGTRAITVVDVDKKKADVEFDFGSLEKYTANLRVDVGQGSYWSEIVQLQTLDNLYKQGVIPNAVTYLQMIPDGVIRDKQALMDAIKATDKPAAQAAGLPPIPGAQNALPQMGDPAAKPTPQMGSAAGMNGETAAMQKVIETLAAMPPEQAQQELNNLPVSDQDKAQIAQVLKIRGMAQPGPMQGGM